MEKNYQTTVTVAASPATKDEARKTGLSVYSYYELPDDTPGFKFIDALGREDWMPKAIFKAKYVCVESHIDRMEAEYSQLTNRILKAQTFMYSEEGRHLPIKQKLFLTQQMDAMNAYASVLAARIDDAKDEQRKAAKPVDYSWLSDYELVTPTAHCDTCKIENTDCRKLILADGATLCFKKKESDSSTSNQQE